MGPADPPPHPRPIRQTDSNIGGVAQIGVQHRIKTCSAPRIARAAVRTAASRAERRLQPLDSDLPSRRRSCRCGWGGSSRAPRSRRYRCRPAASRSTSSFCHADPSSSLGLRIHSGLRNLAPQTSDDERFGLFGFPQNLDTAACRVASHGCAKPRWEIRAAGPSLIRSVKIKGRVRTTTVSESCPPLNFVCAPGAKCRYFKARFAAGFPAKNTPPER